MASRAVSTRGYARDTERAMSRRRLDQVRRALAEFDAGGMGSEFDALLASDLKFRDELGKLDNRADVRAYIEGFQEALGGLHIEVERAEEHGDTLLLVVNQSGRGTMSGAEVEERFTWLMTFRGERCVQWQIYADHAEALEAAGLSE
jgi:ketosteroid isomerase-like protein